MVKRTEKEEKKRKTKSRREELVKCLAGDVPELDAPARQERR